MSPRAAAEPRDPDTPLPRGAAATVPARARLRRGGGRSSPDDRRDQTSIGAPGAGRADERAALELAAWPARAVGTAPRPTRVVGADAIADLVARDLPAIGRIHSVFTRAVNIERADGRLLALHGPWPGETISTGRAAPGSIDGPRRRTARLAAPFGIALAEDVSWAAFERGDPVTTDARGRIGLGSLRIDTAGARVVETRVAPGDHRPLAATLAEHCATRAASAPRGSAPGTRARRSGSGERPLGVPDPIDAAGPSRPIDPLGAARITAPAGLATPPTAAALGSAHAREATTRLADGLRRRDLQRFVDGARALIGLGEGLTPAGDDVLVGVLAVLHRAAPSWLACRPDAVAVLADAARAGTTAVAREFLWHALGGHFSGPVVALVTAADREPARAALRDLLAMGATSGADTVAGMRLALRALAG